LYPGELWSYFGIQAPFIQRVQAFPEPNPDTRVFAQPLPTPPASQFNHISPAIHTPLQSLEEKDVGVVEVNEGNVDKSKKASRVKRIAKRKTGAGSDSEVAKLDPTQLAAADIEILDPNRALTDADRLAIALYVSENWIGFKLAQKSHFKTVSIVLMVVLCLQYLID
jgi:hypothetical protein